MRPASTIPSLLTLSACFVLLGGCGSDSAAPIDASVDATLRDTGRPDAGLDAGTAPDAGTGLDAGTTPDAGTPPPEGAFRFLTYNVAGLPDLISGSNPAVNTPMMSPLLNAYDIVLVQEDFSYHDALIGEATHAYISGPSAAPIGRSFGDGLGRLSVFAFADLTREQWDECNGIVGAGTDCLAGKGFTMASHEIAPGVSLHIYDLHMDAGRSADDYSAREAQSRQLVAAMAARSASATVIVAGDTNLKEEDEPLLLELLETAGLTDACRALACPDPHLHDRVMYRNAPGVELTPTVWQIDDRFVDSAGEDLSDHFAVGVDFAWRRTAAP